MSTIKGGQIGQMGRKLRLDGGLQTFVYYVAASAASASGDIHVLDSLPFGVRIPQTLVRVKTPDGAALTATLGHSSYDGTDATAGDPDFFASAINLNSAGVAVYYPPDATANGVAPGGPVSPTAPATVQALTLTLGAITGKAFVAEITVFVDPA